MYLAVETTNTHAGAHRLIKHPPAYSPFQKMDLSSVLHNSLSPDQAVRHNASRMLEEAAQTYGLGTYMATLIGLLRRPEESAAVRIAAGLAAKNSLVNRRDAVKQAEQASRWLGLPDNVRREIKAAAIDALNAPNPAIGTTAAQVVAAMACIELAAGQWLDLLQVLVQNTTNPQALANVKRASIETIGFICEESERIGDTLEKEANLILTAVVNGIQSDDVGLCVASCKALLNSLEFASSAFSHPTERSYIMQRVCVAASSANEELAVAALQCLVKIVNLYYFSMKEYMAGGMEELVLAAMRRTDAEAVQLQAIEFWSTLCDVELDLIEQLENDDSDLLSSNSSNGPEGHQAVLYLARASLPRLLPILLWLLTLQTDEYGDGSGSGDDWTPSMAAATCLRLLAGTVRDQIMSEGLVLSFVQSNIQDPVNWRKREAAAMAFGSVLEGPDPKQMLFLARTALPHLIGLLNDQSVAVRDTAAWCLGEICRGFVDAVQADTATTLQMALLRGLSDRPRVAGNCAWALSHYIEQLNESSIVEVEFYSECLNRLLAAATTRPDASEANLRSSAFQALASVINNAPSKALGMVEQLAVFLVGQIETMDISSELLGQYAVVLASCVKVLSEEQVEGFGDRLLSSLLVHLNPVIVGASSRTPTPNYSESEVTGAEADESASTHASWEDLLLLLGGTVTVMGHRVAPHKEGVARILAACLSGAYHLETSLCTIALIDIGEMAQTLKASFSDLALPFCQVIATVLSSSMISQNVKPKAVSVIGDIALAIGPHFCSAEIHTSIIPILLQAAQAVSQSPANLDDWEQVDFLLEMRIALVETFTCIVQGASDDAAASASLLNTVPIILSFLKAIVVIPKKDEAEFMVSDSLLKSVLGFIGDVASMYGKKMPALKDPWIASFVTEQRRRRNLPQSVASVLQWTVNQLAHI